MAKKAGKIVVVLILVATCAVFAYGWKTDCPMTAGIYVYCPDS